MLRALGKSTALLFPPATIAATQLTMLQPMDSDGEYEPLSSLQFFLSFCFHFFLSFYQFDGVSRSAQPFPPLILWCVCVCVCVCMVYKLPCMLWFVCFPPPLSPPPARTMAFDGHGSPPSSLSSFSFQSPSLPVLFVLTVPRPFGATPQGSVGRVAAAAVRMCFFC